MPQEHLFKVLVIGDLGVGKTSIIKRYVHQIFSQHYRATIGVDFALKVLHWDSDTVIRLQLWDIAGQERYGNMTRVYYREAVGALVVFDVTRASTFDAVLKWKDDLDSKVTLSHGKPVPAVLLANKSDQVCSQQPRLDTFCRENGFVGWFETSAKATLPPYNNDGRLATSFCLRRALTLKRQRDVWLNISWPMKRVQSWIQTQMCRFCLGSTAVLKKEFAVDHVANSDPSKRMEKEEDLQGSVRVSL
uniref:Ras-related protein Rab n=1 Tax=Oncorhynchus tshawytscha TaxID=74940 RepID=A0AAZ3QRM9_ONCTS